MKMSIAKVFACATFLFTCALPLSCSSDDSSSTVVTSVVNALTQNPNGNPVATDSSNSASSRRNVQELKTKLRERSFNIDLRLEKAAGSGTSFGTIKGWQCVSDSMEAYFELGITNSSATVAEYTGTFKRRASGSTVGGNVDVTKTISTNGTGTVTIHDAAVSSATTFVGGTTNTLASSEGYVFAWNSSGLVCANKSGSSNVTFSFSVSSTTKEKTSATTSSDTSLCASLPSAPTYVVPADLSGDEIWDCTAPSGSTAITGVFADELEDKGGTDCQSDSTFWGSSSTTASSCGSDGSSVTDMFCRLKAYYSQVTQAEKSVKRQLECKFEGAAQKSADGEITGFSGQLADAVKFHALDMTVQDD